MSVLTVHDLPGNTLDLIALMVNHAPNRTLTLSGITGVFTVGETITFGTSGATGRVVSWSNPTLVYQLQTFSRPVIDGLTYAWQPAVGNSVTGGTSGAVGTVASIANGGDTFINDGRTYVFGKNATASPVHVMAQGVGKCSHAFYHTAVFTLPPNYYGPMGPFGRAQFNNSVGQVTLIYGGSVNAADLGIAAVRVLK